jgi:hypothetical protein
MKSWEKSRKGEVRRRRDRRLPGCEDYFFFLAAFFAGFFAAAFFVAMRTSPPFDFKNGHTVCVV